MPGFVRVLSPGELAWPDYDGNGQFRSLGNLVVNSNAGLLFVDWERPGRLRVNGTVRVLADDPLLERWPGAQLVVRLAVRQVFPNCPRYIHCSSARDVAVRAWRRPHLPAARLEEQLLVRRRALAQHRHDRSPGGRCRSCACPRRRRQARPRSWTARPRSTRPAHYC
jgi:hypothetical protein